MEQLFLGGSALCSGMQPVSLSFVEQMFQEEEQFHWKEKWQISSSAPEGKAPQFTERDLTQCTTQLFFSSPTKANEAVKRLTSECANIIRSTHHNCLQLIDSGL